MATPKNTCCAPMNNLEPPPQIDGSAGSSPPGSNWPARAYTVRMPETIERK